MKKAKFDLDGPAVFEGYTNGDSWNGWECPAFTFEVASQIIQQQQVDDNTAFYDERLDSFIVIFQLTDDEPIVEVYKGALTEVDGEEVMLYAIGSYGWCWNAVIE